MRLKEEWMGRGGSKMYRKKREEEATRKENGEKRLKVKQEDERMSKK